MVDENKDALVQAVGDAAVADSDGKKRLGCPDAFKLAESHGVKPVEIGKICNQNDIKIQQCQLGCF